MIKFRSKVIRVNEMGGKFYVESKDREFHFDIHDAAVDTVKVDIFETTEAADKFIEEQFN